MEFVGAGILWAFMDLISIQEGDNPDFEFPISMIRYTEEHAPTQRNTYRHRHTHRHTHNTDIHTDIYKD